MKKLLLLALTAVVMAGCAGRVGKPSDKLLNDGHSYQWIVFYDRFYIVHSPECDSCKAMRKQELKELIKELKNETKELQESHSQSWSL